ncbi:MAG: O-antigen ligase family protein [Candidatus Saganbacteria bacterium]|nr:O-antigen ligase family protein [Candidatus Saganbacteria bacterium]
MLDLPIVFFAVVGIFVILLLLIHPRFGVYSFLLFAPFSYYYAFYAIDPDTTGTLLQKSTKDIFILVVYLFWIFYVLIRKQTKFSAFQSTFLILIFVFIAIMQMVRGIPSSAYASVIGLRNMIEFVPLVFLVPSLFLDIKSIKRIVSLSFLCCLIVSLLGIYEVYFKTKSFFALIDFRIHSTLYNPNNLAIYLAIFLLMLLGLYFKKTYFVNKKLSQFLLLLIFACIVLTFSRGAVVGLFMGMIYLFVVNKKKKLILVSILVFVLSMLLVSNYVGKGIDRYRKYARGETDASVTVRLENVNLGLQMLADKPHWLFFGAGFEKVTGVAAQDKDSANSSKTKWVGKSDIPADNHYLALLMGGGIFSLLIFWAILIFLIKETKKLLFIAVDPFLVGVLQSICAIFILFMITGFFGSTWSSFPANFYFWFFVGILISIKMIIKKEQAVKC